MSSILAEPNSLINTRRYAEMDRNKVEGVAYTSPALAAFVARQMLKIVDFSGKERIRLLDPAVGNGELLAALLNELPRRLLESVDVYAFDTDSRAIAFTRDRLAGDFPAVRLTLECRDFLEYLGVMRSSPTDLFSVSKDTDSKQGDFLPFDMIIANPPYVRTQILGTEQAQMLAQRFGLTGRVDLYYPFLLGISDVLSPSGVAGIITSNRFMTTKSGQSVRRELLDRFDIKHVWDLGDTKLFDVAVLPSVLVVRSVKSRTATDATDIPFTTIYETESLPTDNASDVVDALGANDDAVVKIADGRCFCVRHGALDNGGHPTGTWRIRTARTDIWLATVEKNTWSTFSRIGKIRVGIKSTADKVFVRHDWESLGDKAPELLRPLLTRHWAQRFRAAPPKQAKHIKKVLYPHEVTADGKRAVVNLDSYPLSAAYLEQYRNQLESRTYVTAAGRKWFEIWVPQDPAGWESEKLVFPDIAESPTFWIDTEGRVVNGECYWLRCENGADPDWLWLALGIANSKFIEAFYDHRFNNKLYAGRRRFITQYVERFPLPDPARAESQEIIRLARAIHSSIPSVEADDMMRDLDTLVWHVFGLVEESTR